MKKLGVIPLTILMVLGFGTAAGAVMSIEIDFYGGSTSYIQGVYDTGNTIALAPTQDWVMVDIVAAGVPDGNGVAIFSWIINFDSSNMQVSELDSEFPFQFKKEVNNEEGWIKLEAAATIYPDGEVVLGTFRIDCTATSVDELLIAQLSEYNNLLGDGTDFSGLYDGVSVVILQGDSGDTVEASRSHPESYIAGTSFEACLNITHDNTLTALGVEETMPDGWSFASVSGDDPPAVYPDEGTTGVLEFAWVTIPDTPVDFCYTVEVPEDDSGDKNVTGKVIYRSGVGSEEAIPTQPDPDTISQCTYHSGDYNAPDWSINLSELLRGIQFYNMGEYCCDPDGEDGYKPGPGDRSCPYHNSDYNPSDWSIGFSELLRAIQFYNFGSYHCDSSGEDGYAPGDAPSEMLSLQPDESLSATHSYGEYMPGSDVTIATQIEYTGTLSAVGVEAVLPALWTFVSVSGPDVPDIVPSIGKSGKLKFAWITIPDSPIEFSYTVNVSADTVGPQQLSSTVKYRREGGELIEPVLPDPLIFRICECDLNDDGSCDGKDWLLFYPDWGRDDCNEPGVEPCECDLNGDGSCDGSDWLLFYPNWGRTDCL